MHSLTIRIALALAAITFAPSSFAQDAPDVEQQEQTTSSVGFYRLVGVMETASQLQLAADGTYKWMLIVGSLDLFSEGKWTESNGHVILGPHEFSPDTPVFALGEKYRWDREERDAVSAADHIQQKNRAKWTCAFLNQGAFYSSSEDPVNADNLSPEQQFADAVTREQEHRAEYEKAIAAYFARDASERDVSDRDDRREIQARTARLRWEHAVAGLAKTGRAAGQVGTYQPPPLPAQCLFLSEYTPQYPRTGYDANVNWFKGTGVWIGRRDRPRARLNIEAEFSFTDGSVTTANSHELGFAFAPVTDERVLKTIKLVLLHDEQKYISTFDIVPDGKNYAYEVKLDNRVFIKPPFERMRLKIADNKLLPIDGSKGAYIKRKQGS